jgi:hypothetical protein
MFIYYDIFLPIRIRFVDAQPVILFENILTIVSSGKNVIDTSLRYYLGMSHYSSCFCTWQENRTRCFNTLIYGMIWQVSEGAIMKKPPLHSIEYQQFNFKLTAKEPIILPAYKGSTHRYRYCWKIQNLTSLLYVLNVWILTSVICSLNCEAWGG